MYGEFSLVKLFCKQFNEFLILIWIPLIAFLLILILIFFFLTFPLFLFKIPRHKILFHLDWINFFKKKERERERERRRRKRRVLKGFLQECSWEREREMSVTTLTFFPISKPFSIFHIHTSISLRINPWPPIRRRMVSKASHSAHLGLAVQDDFHAFLEVAHRLTLSLTFSVY